MKKSGKETRKISLFPLTPEKALDAFMRVDPKRVLAKEQARRKVKRRKKAKK